MTDTTFKLIDIACLSNFSAFFVLGQNPLWPVVARLNGLYVFDAEPGDRLTRYEAQSFSDATDVREAYRLWKKIPRSSERLVSLSVRDFTVELVNSEPQLVVNSTLVSTDCLQKFLHDAGDDEFADTRTKQGSTLAGRMAEIRNFVEFLVLSEDSDAADHVSSYYITRLNTVMSSYDVLVRNPSYDRRTLQRLAVYTHNIAAAITNTRR
jgi:hypothetical protein